MSAKQTPKTMKFPMVLDVRAAMAAKRKDPVIRAYGMSDGVDYSKLPVYPTLRGAFQAGVNLIKYAEDGKWLKITKEKTAELYPDGALVQPEVYVHPVKAPKVPKQAKANKATKKASKKATKTAEPELTMQQEIDRAADAAQRQEEKEFAAELDKVEQARKKAREKAAAAKVKA